MADIELIELDESKAYMLPYAPAIKVPPGSEYYFLSGATELQKGRDDSGDYPDDIREQTLRVLRRHTQVLEANELTWENVIHVYEFLTDMRDANIVHATMGEFYGDSTWKPANTLIGVNALSVPGARFELDVIAAKAVG